MNPFKLAAGAKIVSAENNGNIINWILLSINDCFNATKFSFKVLFWKTAILEPSFLTTFLGCLRKIAITAPPRFIIIKIRYKYHGTPALLSVLSLLTPIAITDPRAAPKLITPQLQATKNPLWFSVA